LTTRAPWAARSAGGEGVDRRRVEQVQPADLDALDPGQRGARAVRVARAHGDGRAGLAERAGGLQAEAHVTAGDDDVLAGQVDALEDIIGRRRGGESGSDRVLFLCHATRPPPASRTLNGCQFAFLAR
jgi:hypothetical protein